MSKNKELKRARRAHPVLAEPTAAAQPIAPKRAAFTLTLTFDPARPEEVKYDVLSIGEGVARDGDILDALQMTRDDILIKSAVALTKQQMQTPTPSADAA